MHDEIRAMQDLDGPETQRLHSARLLQLPLGSVVNIEPIGRATNV